MFILPLVLSVPFVLSFPAGADRLLDHHQHLDDRGRASRSTKLIPGAESGYAGRENGRRNHRLNRPKKKEATQVKGLPGTGALFPFGLSGEGDSDSLLSQNSGEISLRTDETLTCLEELERLSPWGRFLAKPDLAGEVSGGVAADLRMTCRWRLLGACLGGPRRGFAPGSWRGEADAPVHLCLFLSVAFALPGDQEAAFRAGGGLASSAKVDRAAYGSGGDYVVGLAGASPRAMSSARGGEGGGVWGIEAASGGLG